MNTESGKLHPVCVQHKQLVLRMQGGPVETAAKVVKTGEQFPEGVNYAQRTPAGRRSYTPLFGDRREDECDQLASVVCQTDHLERCLIFILANGNEEMAQFIEALLLDGHILRNGWEQHIPPRQGVAHRQVCEESVSSKQAVLEEDAAVADVAGRPDCVIITEWLWDEGVGEISPLDKSTGERGGRVGRLGGHEDTFVVDDAEEGRRVAFAEATEERALGDDAVEGGAGEGGASERRRCGQAEEYLLQVHIRKGQERGLCRTFGDWRRR